MIRLMKYVGSYKKYAIIAPLSILFEVLLDVFIPYKLAQIINIGSEGDISYVIKMGIILSLLTILALILGTVSGYASSLAGTMLAKNLRDELFNKATDFSFSNIDKFSPPSLITRMTVDVNNVQQSYMMLIRVFVRSPLLLIFATIMAFIINKRVAITFLVSIPILGVLLMFIATKAFPKFQVMLKRYDIMNRNIQENLTGIRAVKAYVREDFETEKLTNAADEVKKAQVAAESILALNMPIMQLIVGFTIGAVLFFGGKEVIAGTMMAGDIVTLITYGTQILMSLMIMSMIVVMLVLSQVSVNRICEVLDEEIDITNSKEAIDKDLKVKSGKIEFKHVYFKYKNSKSQEILDIKDEKKSKGKNTDEKNIDSKLVEDEEQYVLKDINVTIESGKTIGIIGATGSSKSTFASLIPRLYDVDKGKVLVGGVDVKDYTLKNLRDAVSVVLQKNELFSGTIMDNLRWGKQDLTCDEACEVAKIASADEFIMQKPEGYDYMLEQGGSNVSGGQKQRLTIARALLKNPKILILDDSMSAVDTKTDKSIRKALKSYKSDATKIIIAQRITSIMDSDEIIVLDDGKIAGFGTHKELLVNCDIYKEIYESQRNGGK